MVETILIMLGIFVFSILGVLLLMLYITRDRDRPRPEPRGFPLHNEPAERRADE